MYDVILLLGSNLGDRQTLLCRARALIAQQIGAVVQQSALYESEPWGFRSNSWFINQVIKVNTSLEPEPLLAATQQIETLLGRTARRAQRYASRTIDIDILFFDNRCVDTHTRVNHTPPPPARTALYPAPAPRDSARPATPGMAKDNSRAAATMPRQRSGTAAINGQLTTGN